VLKETKSFGATSGISYHSARLLDLARQKNVCTLNFTVTTLRRLATSREERSRPHQTARR